MHCARCNAVVNDTAQCSCCKKVLGFCCAGVSEQGYRKLGAERRSVWRCSSCRAEATSPLPTSESVTLDSIMLELRSMKNHLASLPVLMQDVKSIKNEIEELKKSCEFNSSILDDHNARLQSVENELPKIAALQENIHSLNNEVTVLRGELNGRDQWQRLNNIEIKGVPLKKNENLFTVVDHISKAVDYPIQKSSINYISRVPMLNSKEKLIIVSFTNRYIKEDFIASARSKKKILASDIGFSDSTQLIFLNDHLTPEYKRLLTSVKTTMKAKGYQYIWVKYGKIHVRMNDTSKIFIVNSHTDLNKLQ